MWTWLVAAALGSPGDLPSAATVLPTLPASTRTHAGFTIGTVDLRRVGRADDEANARRRLLQYARDRGLPARGGEATGPDRSVEARFVLLGELRPAADSPPRATMRWQLVDRRDETTLFEAATTVSVAEGDRPLQQAFERLLRSGTLTAALVRAARRARSSDGPIRLRKCLTPGTHGRGRIGRGPSAGAAVVVSPDGFVWAAAHSLPLPPAPIEVRTTTGTWAARWIAASADVDVALLALPTGAETPCAALADHIPRAREPALAWHPRQGRQRTRILGFRLHEHPGTIVVEAELAPGAFLFDAKGAVLGLRARGTHEPRIRPHEALADSLGVRWSNVSVVPAARGVSVSRPDPIFLPPVDRSDGDPLQ